MKISIADGLTAAKIAIIATSNQMQDFISGSNSKPAIMDAYAEYCGHSHAMVKTVTDLNDKYQNWVTFVGLDAIQSRDISAGYKVTGLPTFVGFACGKEVDRVVGSDKDGLEKLVLRLKDTKC